MTIPIKGGALITGSLFHKDVVWWLKNEVERSVIGLGFIMIHTSEKFWINESGWSKW